VAPHEGQIAAVGLEPQVERIARDRHQADDKVERRVRQHSGHDDPRQAEARGAPDDEQADRPAREVAHPRHETDQRVEAEASATGERDPDALIEQPGEGLHLGERLRASISGHGPRAGEGYRGAHGLRTMHDRCLGGCRTLRAPRPEPRNAPAGDRLA